MKWLADPPCPISLYFLILAYAFEHIGSVRYTLLRNALFYSSLLRISLFLPSPLSSLLSPLYTFSLFYSLFFPLQSVFDNPFRKEF